MSNITIDIDDELLSRGRGYARKRRLSFNGLVRQLLEQAVSREQGAWAAEFLALSERISGDSGGWTFNRDDVHEEREARNLR
jgi:predicted HicB family RNase H-like nuclease